MSWEKREARYRKKFDAGREHILSDIFSWLPPSTPLKQIGVFISRPKNRQTLAGGTIMLIDEFMAEVRAKVVACGVMSRNAIPEQFSLLRTIQLTHVGYYKII